MLALRELRWEGSPNRPLIFLVGVTKARPVVGAEVLIAYGLRVQVVVMDHCVAREGAELNWMILVHLTVLVLVFVIVWLELHVTRARYTRLFAVACIVLPLVWMKKSGR